VTDDTERRKQFLKQRLRMLRGARRLAEKLRPSTPEAIDQRWKDQQLRWEVEDELDREEEAAVVKRRQLEAEAQQESAVNDPHSPEAPQTADDPPPVESKLKEASDDETRAAVRAIYKPCSPGTGPSLSAIVPLTQDKLKSLGLRKSKQRIQDLAGEKEFDGVRAPQGKRRT
jgi:hypothetical protein